MEILLSATQKIALSPMADMTDSPFCLIAKKLGARLVFREMISSEALVRDNVKTFHMAKFHEQERPIIQQIFGADPDVMLRAAQIIEKNFQPNGIDINMGCPVNKLTSNFNGASLMRDPKLASQIVKKVKAGIKVPLSVKTRLGWSEKTEILDFIKYLEDAGADLVSIHGRTKAQAYSGEADWEIIAQAKQQVKIPVFANGDINTPEKVKQALEITKADGVLIGRGALGNPWIFKQAEDFLEKGEYKKISLQEKLNTMLEHAKMHIQHYGERGIITFRKHASWYLKAEKNIKPFRQELLQTKTFEDFEKKVKNYINQIS